MPRGRLARTLGVWLLLMAAETVHGILRETWLAPRTGSFEARRIAVVSGSVLILTIAYLTIGWIGLRSKGELLGAGLLWVGLTILFEAGLGLALGFSTQRILEDYDLMRGGLMLFGLLLLGLAPWIAFRLRRLGH